MSAKKLWYHTIMLLNYNYLSFSDNKLRMLSGLIHYVTIGYITIFIIISGKANIVRIDQICILC
ncbi:protein of unknown function [Candidatus Nitrosocosmicus franklandus]|uniref:Uncharacterized protein n=1 Tax=Candidatus Nitrosocosmicus franklandianus TaxID=1798806 RepID=A0A484IAI7_9ARCH|nr:protein of unknown function [Candidatus Nitrosocosmicus franklandus]